MIDGMPRKLPLYVTREISRHGRVKYFFRRGKGKRIRLPDEFPSPEFDRAYIDAMAGQAPKPQVRASSPSDRLEWLVARFMESAKWASASSATRRQRELFYLKTIERAGNPYFTAIERRHMQNAIDDRAGTPALAKNYLKAMRALFSWAATNGHVQTNPCDGVELPAYRTDGFPPWTIEDVVSFCERWPIGTMPRLALELFLVSGLRRGDVHQAGRQHLRGRVFTMKTSKTGIEVTVEFPQSLMDIIAATKTGDLHFIVKEDGNPFTSKESFGNWFSARCRDACVKKSAHGIRKLAATLAANDGASAHELMAHFGWVKVEQAEVYTKQADRKRLGMRSSARVSDQIKNAIPRTLDPSAGKIAKNSIKTKAK